MPPWNLKRRQFLLSSALALSGGCFGGCGDENTGGRVVAGPLSEFPLGTRTLLSAEKVFVIHVTEGLAAISAKCTHQGCTLQAQESTDGFSCACHNSRFDAQGRVTQGPAQDPLGWFAILIEGDQVIVDLDTPVNSGIYTSAT